MHIMATENVTMNNHHYGIFSDHFYNTPDLTSMFNVLSTNRDRAGASFISSMEGKSLPIYGTQWHPEKNAFEWALNQKTGFPYEAINHSWNAILVTQYTANMFVQQTRKSTHKFRSWQDEDKALIWNYPVTRTQEDFVQRYFFPWTH